MSERAFVDANVFVYAERLHRLSFWDALIVKAASAAGCRKLLTEDLSAGHVIDGVTVESPF